MKDADAVRTRLVKQKVYDSLEELVEKLGLNFEDFSNLDEVAPKPNIVNQLVYTASGNDVATVIIDGKIIVSKGKVITLDEGDYVRKAQQVAIDLLERGGIAKEKMSWRWAKVA